MSEENIVMRKQYRPAKKKVPNQERTAHFLENATRKKNGSVVNSTLSPI